MKISQQRNYDVDWMAEVAHAACLSLDEDRLAEFAQEIGAELNSLAELDCDGSFDLNAKNALGLEEFREDQVGECLPWEGLLSAAPRRDGDCFLVPEVLGEGSGSA